MSLFVQCHVWKLYNIQELVQVTYTKLDMSLRNKYKYLLNDGRS